MVLFPLTGSHVHLVLGDLTTLITATRLEVLFTLTPGAVPSLRVAGDEIS